MSFTPNSTFQRPFFFHFHFFLDLFDIWWFIKDCREEHYFYIYYLNELELFWRRFWYYQPSSHRLPKDYLHKGRWRAWIIHLFRQSWCRGVKHLRSLGKELHWCPKQPIRTGSYAWPWELWYFRWAHQGKRTSFGGTFISDQRRGSKEEKAKEKLQSYQEDGQDDNG